MKTKTEKTERGVIIKRADADGYSSFNITLYNELGNKKWEYDIDDIPIFNKTVRRAYDECPWHNIKYFRYKGSFCKLKNVRIVFDGGGYVLKINFSKGGVDTYRYVQNINSLKYLKLLKIKDIEIIEYLKND